MSPEVPLYNSEGNKIGSYVKLGNLKVRVYGLYTAYGFDQFILTTNEFEKTKTRFGLSIKTQTDIFEFL
ncbi:TPA: hypothetical protein I1715_002282 [Staphylococcus pseudintermedius]|uniref:hypothetical protein n=1 Tax=Staphylococcus pseudintermedius TaxID=283734 RepID=UPI00111E8C1B|nr:hypothetical protein [Staphylococcus pseudintermedius]EGQ3278804.1 hypothetical protein [Staphylococcus pseudintermedius]EGQ3506748.1 hypothetical protein [Staphylococcus pseudintermedius]EHK3763442.1 hypothetical protein [Staphylococcus pseudintermedius]EIN4282412.1 hypothetical protein [Staphylococcus pseudintermedius]EIQ3994617.1 hypothetical protein [Staphylococcus pseudintermedius]